MQTIRAYTRLTLIAGFTLFYYFLIVISFILHPFGVKSFKWKAFVRRKWGESISKLLGIQLSVRGDAPNPPFFLVCNHLSYTDIWVLFSQLNCTFIAKREVREWPVIGFILHTSGIIFIDRENRKDVTRVNDEIEKNLNKYQGIILFPEGTTSSGKEILPFKSSLFQFPAQSELPVSCASIRYETPEQEVRASHTVCWWDDTPFFTHLINLLKMKEFSATLTFCDTNVTNSNRKILATSSRKLIQESFVPVIQPDNYAKTNISS